MPFINFLCRSTSRFNFSDIPSLFTGILSKSWRSNPTRLPSRIYFSLQSGEDDVKKALALGADDYFVKTQHSMSEIVEKAKKYEETIAKTVNTQQF